MTSRQSLMCVASLALIAMGAAHAQEFSTRVTPINARQVQEIRLGGTTRSPLSTLSGAGLVAVAVTNGPVANTTTLTGAFIDGGTLFTGGALPTFTPIVAQGSVFSVGGGCTRGAFTDFPYINANRPQIARFDASTGLFTTFTPSIPGTDQFDSADCAVDSNDTVFVFTNRTLRRIEIYKDNGSGLVPVQNTAQNSVITPFSGGLRPSVVVGDFNGDEAADILSMNPAGGTLLQLVNTNTGALGTPCVIATTTPPTVFTKPPETNLFLPNAPNDPQRIATGDFNLDGVADIITVTNRTACTLTNTAGPAGSANGGNGYNWTGYAIAQVRTGAPINVVWGSYFYVNNGASVASPAPVPSPYVGRGGPFDACGGRNLDRGSAFVAVGTAAANTEAQFSISPGLLANVDVIMQTGQENTSFLADPKCLRLGF